LKVYRGTRTPSSAMSAKHEELQPQEPVADESVRVPSPDGPNKLRERSNGSRCRFAWASELSAPSGLNRGKLRGRPAFYDFMSSAGRIVALRKSVQLPRFAPTTVLFRRVSAHYRGRRSAPGDL